MEEGQDAEHPDDGLVENVWGFLQCEGLWAGQRYSVLRHTRLGTATEMWGGSDDFSVPSMPPDEGTNVSLVRGRHFKNARFRSCC